jgi:uncharacterized membrane protein YvlD (DUF360 family)
VHVRLHRDDLGRLVLSWAGATITLWLVDALLPGLTFERWYVAALVAFVAGIVGVLARPVLIGLAARLGWLAVILCAAIGEAVILGGAMALVPGVEVQSGWTLIATAWLAGLVGTLLAWIASAGTDEGFATALVRRRADRRHDIPADGGDGVLVVQLDGVPYPVLQWALSADAGLTGTIAAGQSEPVSTRSIFPPAISPRSTCWSLPIYDRPARPCSPVRPHRPPQRQRRSRLRF